MQVQQHFYLQDYRRHSVIHSEVGASVQAFNNNLRTSN